MSIDSDAKQAEALAKIAKELGLLRQGLALLGRKGCSQCGKFFRTANAGALFDAGEPVASIALKSGGYAGVNSSR